MESANAYIANPWEMVNQVDWNTGTSENYDWVKDQVIKNPWTSFIYSDMLLGGAGNRTAIADAKRQYMAQAALQANQQQFNSQEAQMEREWQERMSNSAYQRSTADLMKAGLNPWLAVQNPASAGQGAFGSSAQGSASMVNNKAVDAMNQASRNRVEYFRMILDYFKELSKMGGNMAMSFAG